MRSRTRGFWTAAWLSALAMTVAAAVGTDVKPTARDAERAVSTGEASEVQAAADIDLMQMIHPLPADAVVIPVALGEPPADGSTAAVSTLVYSNTLGKSVFAPSAAGSRFADDITTTGANGCLLDKFTFRVSGNSDGSLVNPTPFSVEYALYTSCPGATFTPVAIAGTTGTFAPADDGLGLYDVTVTIPAITDIPIPPRLYLGLRFSRTKVGAILGAPALVGFSDDRFDYPVAVRCGASFGTFPVSPHASLNAEIYVRGTCSRQFAIYSNSQHAASAFSPGSGTLFADDIEIDDAQLGGEGSGCQQLAGYEVALKATTRTGSGGVEVDLRGFLDNNNPADGGLILGTRKQIFVFGDTPAKLNVTFDPPISLASLPNPTKLFAVFKTSSAVVGPILTCRDADIGTTQDLYQEFSPGALSWTEADPGPSCHAAFDVTLFCAGEAPAGACCDMVLRENRVCIAGPNDGQSCRFPGDCPSGNCAGDSICRDVARINCAFPDRWRKGAVCASTCQGGVNQGLPCTRQVDCPGGNCPGPWVDGQPCGLSRCCTHDDFCNNLTEKDCFGTPPIESSRVNLFDRGHFCDEGGRRCPFGACLGREGECSLARDAICRGGRHDGEVCNLDEPFFSSLCFRDGYCDDGVTECDTVLQNCGGGGGTCRGGTCTGVPGCKDAICCTAVCDLDFFCCDTHWDPTCAARAAEICTGKPIIDECPGAELVEIPSVDEYNAITSTAGGSDPGFCCKANDPGGFGDNTIWFRFVAPPAPPGSTRSSVQVTTCGTTTGGVNPADDSMLQGFSIGTPDAGLCANNPVATCSVSTQDCPTGEGPCEPDLKTWCQNLSPLGCNDNSETACCLGPTCTPGNSRLCMQDLVPGQTYYVMLGTKDSSHKGNYRLTVSSPCASQKPLKTNDLCPNAAVLDGSSLQVPFDLAGSPTVQAATFDCPGPSCQLPMFNDLWYQWVAPENGELTVDTCGGDPQPETTLVLYEGCDCPVQVFRERRCSPTILRQDCFLGSEAVISVTRNQCYKFRLGGVGGATPAGTLNVNFRGCPIGNVTFLDPPDGVIDARQPFSPDSPATRQGIQTVRVAGPPGTDNTTCWAICETVSAGTAIGIQGATDNLDGTFTIRFTRPITSRAVTSLTFIQGDATEQRMVMTYHPGNVDGNGLSETADLISLAGFLTGPTVAPWGSYSMDTDRSGTGVPADLLRLIDMLRSAATYPSTNNIPLPLCGICCPAGP